jgi:hypothetical protein
MSPAGTVAVRRADATGCGARDWLRWPLRPWRPSVLDRHSRPATSAPVGAHVRAPVGHPRGTAALGVRASPRARAAVRRMVEVVPRGSGRARGLPAWAADRLLVRVTAPNGPAAAAAGLRAARSADRGLARERSRGAGWLVTRTNASPRRIRPTRRHDVKTRGRQDSLLLAVRHFRTHGPRPQSPWRGVHLTRRSPYTAAR